MEEVHKEGLRRISLRKVSVEDNETVVLDGVTVTAVPHAGRGYCCGLCVVSYMRPQGGCALVSCSRLEREGGRGIIFVPAGNEAAAAAAIGVEDEIAGMEAALRAAVEQDHDAGCVRPVEWAGATGSMCSWCIGEKGAGCHRDSCCGLKGFYTTEGLLPVAEALQKAYAKRHALEKGLADARREAFRKAGLYAEEAEDGEA